MIRLYVDKVFKSGLQLELPAEELRYFKSVRRGQGDVRLFNRQGEEALGAVDGKVFKIDRVLKVDIPLYPLSVGVGMPETSVIPSIVRSLSELGVEELFFFEAERSQNFKKRAAVSSSVIGRWAKLAVEGARQCGRPKPLEISLRSWKEKDFLKRFDRILFFDEAKSSLPSASSITVTKNQRLLALVGCEGGWTESERDVARQHGFFGVHFETPILRVETAVVCASFRSLQILGLGEGG